MGLENRFSENYSVFKSINVSLKTGIKEFNGHGTYDNGKIKYNFNGVTETLSINNIFEKYAKMLNSMTHYNSYIVKEVLIF